MNQVNTTETVALSAPVLEALRRLDAANAAAASR